jgi:N-acetyltransferase 10
MVRVTDAELEGSTLLQDNIKIRDISAMPPLFAKLDERKPPALDYVGVSYGLTQSLLKFWNRRGFSPVYLRQTPNDLTGEHTTVMIRALNQDQNDVSWLGEFARDFHHRFHSLLSYQFRTFPSILSLSIDASTLKGSELDTSSPPKPLTKSELDSTFSPFDLKRLDKYADQMLDYHVILDMLPTIATLYFSGRLKDVVSLSPVQQSILLAVGLQRKAVEELEKELNLAVSQLLGLFVKIMRKFSTAFRGLVEGAVAATMPEANGNGLNGEKEGEGRFKPLAMTLEEDLEEGRKGVLDEERERVKAMIDANVEK